MKRLIIVGLVLFVAGLAVGFLMRGGPAPGHDHGPAITVPAPAGAYTCSMHPQIRSPKPGQCPICGMDLIPVITDAASVSDQPRQLVLSPAARALAEIALAPVERRAVAVEIRMVGKVQFDETRLAYIAPRVPGRIDRLYANYTGMPVRPGDHLADMYSPELVSAQQELLQAMKATGGPAASAVLLNATRERLRLWGLTADQIAAIEQSGQVRDHVTFYAPIGGIVVEKEAREGMYVETGMRLFTVADLSRVWVVLDAYESDLAWLRYAQEVAFQAEAYPGETFKGTIAFIDPLLDPMTRTVKVRVNVANADGRLKPEMFVRAVVSATVAGDGKVLRADLRGKWISPMHPEIVKDASGTCDVCGMPLVRAEDLGYAVPDEPPAMLPLVIPATAPLVTGKRAVVYVALPGADGTYEGHDIILGPRAGGYYIVREGLKEGDLVVVNGNFKIDSSLQIQGKPSMLTAPDNAEPVAVPASAPVVPPPAATPAAFREQIAGVLAGVLVIADALAADDFAAARTGAATATQALAGVNMALFSGDVHVRWMEAVGALNLTLDKMTAAQDIAAFRGDFGVLAPEMARVLKVFGPVGTAPVHVLHCPMAFNNRGADWLQKDTQVRNPYFGKAMLSCGEVIETIPSAGAPGTGEARP
ncbi:MAG: efflux RND transporter periplasmic adaptor subunit [Planctomycetota bacterium]